MELSERESKVVSHFKSMSPSFRKKIHEHYIEIIAYEKGDKQPTASSNKKYHPMPWMLDAWQNGLRLLESVMREKGELPA